MSVELYLLVNLCSDAVLIFAVTRALGCYSMRRLSISSGLCVLYALAVALSPIPLSAPGIQLALLGAVSYYLAGRVLPTAWRIALLLGCSALISGGVGLLAAEGLPALACAPLCSAAAGAAISLALLARHPIRDSWQVNIVLRLSEHTYRFKALLDTGNRLREPLSGLPVLIAESGLFEGNLPKSGWRRLSYGAIGAQGELACFRPSAVWIERGHRKRRAPDVWVAISQTPLPGSARALAPCEYACL